LPLKWRLRTRSGRPWSRAENGRVRIKGPGVGGSSFALQVDGFSVSVIRM
jgi:hypothetical protein